MAQRNANENQTNQDPKTQDPNPSNTGNSSIPSYLEAAARLSTSYPLGAKHKDKRMFGHSDGFYKVANDTGATTGGIVIDFLPTYGVSTSPTSALNRAAFDQFNIIRSKISGNRPYEPVDHMIYRQCVDSLRELYATIGRIYTIIAGYSATNVYRARYIVEAMGYDFDDWNANAANVYQWLKNHASALKPFPTVPIGTISARHQAYATYIFTDGDIDSTQAYIFNQKAFYSYEVVDEVKGITLREAAPTSQGMFDLWDQLYAALQSSSDVYIIAADIRRAFEDSAIWELTPPAADAVVQYVKLDPVLTSIMNCNTVSLGAISGGETIDEIIGLNSFRIKDGGNGMLICAPKYVADVRYPRDVNQGYGFYFPVNFQHLNFVDPNPDTATIINAVRHHAVLSIDLTFGTEFSEDLIPTNVMTGDVVITSMATEVILGGHYFTLNYDASTGAATGVELLPFASGYLYDSNVLTNVRDNEIGNPFSIMNKWSACDWTMPIRMAIANLFNINDSSTCSGTIEDVQNYVPVSDDVITEIHNAMLLAEFGIK